MFIMKKVCEMNISSPIGSKPWAFHDESKVPVVDSAAFYPNVLFNLTNASVVLLCPTIKYIKLDKTTSLHIKFILLLTISPKLNNIDSEILQGYLKINDKKHMP
jgi:hypothetical protein